MPGTLPVLDHCQMLQLSPPQFDAGTAGSSTCQLATQSGCPASANSTVCSNEAQLEAPV